MVASEFRPCVRTYQIKKIYDEYSFREHVDYLLSVPLPDRIKRKCLKNVVFTASLGESQDSKSEPKIDLAGFNGFVAFPSVFYSPKFVDTGQRYRFVVVAEPSRDSPKIEGVFEARLFRPLNEYENGLKGPHILEGRDFCSMRRIAFGNSNLFDSISTTFSVVRADYEWLVNNHSMIIEGLEKCEARKKERYLRG